MLYMIHGLGILGHLINMMERYVLSTYVTWSDKTTLTAAKYTNYL